MSTTRLPPVPVSHFMAGSMISEPGEVEITFLTEISRVILTSVSDGGIRGGWKDQSAEWVFQPVPL